MPWYQKDGDTWSEQSGPLENGLSVQIRTDDPDEPPSIRVLESSAERLHLTGAEPRPDTDTTHTVARIQPDSSGVRLFVVHAQGSDLIFEDLRASDGPDASDAALDQVQSALNEIMIPVYIDDVISDLSEQLSGLLVLHTIQYASEGTGPWTYFRSAAFEEGDLSFEMERGEL